MIRSSSFSTLFRVYDFISGVRLYFGCSTLFRVFDIVRILMVQTVTESGWQLQSTDDAGLQNPSCPNCSTQDRCVGGPSNIRICRIVAPEVQFRPDRRSRLMSSRSPERTAQIQRPPASRHYRTGPILRSLSATTSSGSAATPRTPRQAVLGRVRSGWPLT